MLLRQPRYFKDFRCIGGACTDSCCVGWEIPIDNETNARYQSRPGAFGERLRAGISAPKDGHFLLREGRCPFLNRQGLCEIILEMGEEALCQICADHPRYYNRLPGRVEAGLGLCCEAAGRLIFSDPRPVEWDCFPAEGEEPPAALPDDTAALLSARDTALALLQNRRAPLRVRLRRLLFYALEWQDSLDMGLPYPAGPPADDGAEEPSPADYRALLVFFAGREAICPGWPARLQALSDELPRLLAAAPAFCRALGGRLYEYERLAVYYADRYFIQAAEDGELLPRVKFAIASLLVQLLLDLSLWLEKGEYTPADRIHTAKAYAKEMEYSEENLAAFLKASWELDCLASERLAAMLGPLP